MRSIDVDADVFSLIWSLRTPPEETENEILKRILDNYHRDKLKFSIANEGIEVSEVKTSRQTSKNLIPSIGNQTLREGEGNMISGKIRWVDDIRAALQQLGGEASLHEIYKSVRDRRNEAGRSVPASRWSMRWGASVSFRRLLDKPVTYFREPTGRLHCGQFAR